MGRRKRPGDARYHMEVLYPAGDRQRALRLNCKKNGCMEKFGFEHSDNGRIYGCVDWEHWRRATVNGHACDRVERILPPWRDVRARGD